MNCHGVVCSCYEGDANGKLTYVPESKPAVLVGLIYNNFHRQIPSGSTGNLLLAPLTGLTIQSVSQVRRDWI